MYWRDLFLFTMTLLPINFWWLCLPFNITFLPLCLFYLCEAVLVRRLTTNVFLPLHACPIFLPFEEKENYRPVSSGTFSVMHGMCLSDACLYQRNVKGKYQPVPNRQWWGRGRREEGRGGGGCLPCVYGVERWYLPHTGEGEEQCAADPHCLWH